MKDFEADDLEEQVLKEERERIRPLLERCRQVIDTYCDPAQPEVLADLRRELGR